MARTTRSRKQHSGSVRFKWTKELIILLSVLAVAIILTIVCLVPTKKEKFYSEFTDAAAAVSDATAIPEDHVFSYISYSDLLKKKASATESEPLFVLYGSSADTTTITNLYELNSRADEYEVSHIYILNCKFAMETDQDDEVELKFVEDREEELGVKDLFTYCQLWVFENDELVWNSQDVIDDDGLEVEPTFSFAVFKCMSTYSPKALELKNTSQE